MTDIHLISHFLAVKNDYENSRILKKTAKWRIAQTSETRLLIKVSHLNSQFPVQFYSHKKLMRVWINMFDF